MVFQIDGFCINFRFKNNKHFPTLLCVCMLDHGETSLILFFFKHFSTLFLHKFYKHVSHCTYIEARNNYVCTWPEPAALKSPPLRATSFHYSDPPSDLGNCHWTRIQRVASLCRPYNYYSSIIGETSLKIWYRYNMKIDCLHYMKSIYNCTDRKVCW